MNKVILMGRLTRDPELRYSQSENPIAITKYMLAVNRQYKREGNQEADFINIIAFGKRGEFAHKYFKKGQMVAVVGSIQVHRDTTQDGQAKYYTEVLVSDQYFAESKATFEARSGQPSVNNNLTTQNTEVKEDGFYQIEDGLDDDDLPF